MPNKKNLAVCPNCGAPIGAAFARIGGQALNAKLTPAERRKSAQRAVNARWAKAKGKLKQTS